MKLRNGSYSNLLLLMAGFPYFFLKQKYYKSTSGNYIPIIGHTKSSRTNENITGRRLRRLPAMFALYS